MSLQSDQQLANTQQKLSLLEQWIAEAKLRPDTSQNRASLCSLVQTANELREEIVRYRSRQKRRAS